MGSHATGSTLLLKPADPSPSESTSGVTETKAYFPNKSGAALVLHNFLFYSTKHEIPEIQQYQMANRKHER